MFSKPLTPDAELRPLDLAQVEPLWELVDANRERLRQWFAWVDADRSVDDIAKFVKSAMERHARDEGLTAVIHYQGRAVGAIDFHDWRPVHRYTAIGYWLAASAEGKGLMTAAVTAMVDYAFTERGMNRVEIRCATQNERSRVVPRRLGFVEEGTMRQAELLYDRYNDLVVYAMLRAEWLARRAGT
ncbi:MAG: GNAT family N-acetyltransferase [Phycisphaerae bacterium]|nr:GNAT family N-acetyltransferase [Tepidisphaeraceae bacterium]